MLSAVGATWSSDSWTSFSERNWILHSMLPSWIFHRQTLKAVCFSYHRKPEKQISSFLLRETSLLFVITDGCVACKHKGNHQRHTKTNRKAPNFAITIPRNPFVEKRRWENKSACLRISGGRQGVWEVFLSWGMSFFFLYLNLGKHFFFCTVKLDSTYRILLLNHLHFLKLPEVHFIALKESWRTKAAEKKILKRVLSHGGCTCASVLSRG